MSKGARTLLFLDTRDAQNPGFPHDPVWLLKELSLPQGWGSLALMQCEFVNPFPSFRLGIDDQLIIRFWNNGGGAENTITYTIPPGQYTLNQIITELNVLFTATVPAAWGGLAANALQASTATINTTLAITFSVPVADRDGRGFEFVDSTFNTAGPNLGLSSLVTATSTFPGRVDTLTGNMVNLAGVEALNVVTDTFRFQNYSTGNQSNIMARLDIDVPFGDTYRYQATLECPQRINLQDCNQIHLRFVDQDNDDVIFPPDSHILMTLIIEFSID